MNTVKKNVHFLRLSFPLSNIQQKQGHFKPNEDYPTFKVDSPTSNVQK